MEARAERTSRSGFALLGHLARRAGQLTRQAPLAACFQAWKPKARGFPRGKQGM